jgi:hypothetical protein
VKAHFLRIKNGRVRATIYAAGKKLTEYDLLDGVTIAVVSESAPEQIIGGFAEAVTPEQIVDGIPKRVDLGLMTITGLTALADEEKGASLIETVVVIGIIALVAGIGVPILLDALHFVKEMSALVSHIVVK